MSKSLQVSYDVPGDVEQVFAVLSGDGWAAAKAAAFGDDSVMESRQLGSSGSVTVTLSRGLPDGIPGFLEKFLPAGGRVRQIETWGPSENGARRGTWSGEIPGAPAKLGGTMSLEPIASGTRYTITGQAKVAVPLIGGKAESFIVDMVARLTAKEAELLAEQV